MVMARPGYACYRNVLKALGCEVVEIDCGPETRFQPTVRQLEALAGPIAGLVIASPANPTGTMLLPDELDAIAEWCEARGVRLISDEIYHGIDYGYVGRHSEPPLRLAHLALGDRVRVVQQVLLDDRVAARLDAGARRTCAARSTSSPATSPSARPCSASTPPSPPSRRESYAELDGHVARYAANREQLLVGLPRIGIHRLAPADGAFYVYADIGHLTDDSYAWCQRLLDETGVATAPGIDFDTRRGNQFVRMSFAGSEKEIVEGIERLGAWLH